MSRIFKWSPLIIAGVLACSEHTPAPLDGVAPGRVHDLRVKSATTNVITLRWTTPGDNGFSGVATGYQVRWSPEIITEDNFSSAHAIPDPPIPAEPGTPEVFSVPNMDITQVLHFALRTFDENLTMSAVSNDALYAPGSVPVQYLKDLPAVRDNTIYAEDGSASNGAGHYFFAGKSDDGLTRRGLLDFAVSDSIPRGAQIDSVRLVLHVSRTSSGQRTMELHKALASWGEGTSNASINGDSGSPATSQDATWTYRLFNTDTWAAAGADFDSTASAQLPVDGFAAPEFATWRSPRMIVDVRHWLDVPDSNFGWVVLGSETGTTATRSMKRFDSREHPTAAYHPRLRVYYTVLP